MTIPPLDGGHIPHRDPWSETLGKTPRPSPPSPRPPARRLSTQVSSLVPSVSLRQSSPVPGPQCAAAKPRSPNGNTNGTCQATNTCWIGKGTHFPSSTDLRPGRSQIPLDHIRTPTLVWYFSSWGSTLPYHPLTRCRATKRPSFSRPPPLGPDRTDQIRPARSMTPPGRSCLHLSCLLSRLVTHTFSPCLVIRRQLPDYIHP
ncbi:hypothetical protein F5X68DRAFT_11037 [Plectosphaerella plurivora]|uniref:Uncharacterized protein n=1 Tax=Plectosphaerella plurivora TaxID=936078 RepID=A0A9P8VD26_9PEZI|nr:hypothetical protein F5X68DRAFT_11037 [Plectosphaerella plurivora]